MQKTNASILDFPRNTLSEDIWQYSGEKKHEELPKLKHNLRYTIISNIEKYLKTLNLSLVGTNLYGGAASYQWSPSSDIDVSIYAAGWPEGISADTVEKYQAFFKDIEIPFSGYEIHLFLKPPHDVDMEVADAIYDILQDEWVLPPLILPNDFDPDEYFKPFIKSAEEKAKKLDQDIGKLQRAWKTLEKASEALPQAAEPEVVKDRIEKEKEVIRYLVNKLATSFLKTREKRYALHDRIKEKMIADPNVGRMARFQEPEIVWKYLDRAGYVEFLHKLYKLQHEKKLEQVLAKY